MTAVVVMGSGETAPTMVRAHREVFAAGPDGPAVLLDTPFAFQMNRDELVARTVGYFAQSVGRDVETVHWPPLDGSAPAAERALARLDQAVWAFAGPGSPTYALRQWQGTPVPAALAAVVRRGGTLLLGSAAALTLGTHTVPVYEVYKVGEEPRWTPGLDLLGELTGLRAAVIPHYDNNEGGTHDTRFCYLGEQRLAALESDLPEDVGVLGVDEHTAAVLDLDAKVLRVLGNGTVSVRRAGVTQVFVAGTEVPIDELAALLRGERGAAPAAVEPKPAAIAATDLPAEQSVTSLRAEADRARADFDTAVAARDPDGCVAAVLRLESAIADWSADTLQSSDADEARRVLRALVTRLGELSASGLRDPREVVAPYVEALLSQRTRARAAGDYAASDDVRDRLVALGVEVQDTPEGTRWELSGV